MPKAAEAKARKEAEALRRQVKAAAPGWVVTYGDVMSLLLTFFIMLYSMSELKDKKAVEIIQSIRSYFHREELPSKGYTLIPLRLYLNERGRIKVELGLARGKAKADRRRDIMEREARRDLERSLKEAGRGRSGRE